MKKFRISILALLLCMFCAAPLSAAEDSGAGTAAPAAAETQGSGFDFVNSSLDQILGSIAPALEKLAKEQLKNAEAHSWLWKSRAWSGLAKFFGGGLDCLNALKNGWDVGTAINNCISAIQKKDFSDFTKQFTDVAKTTTKLVAGIATTALVAWGGTAGAPVLVLVGAGFAIGVTTDYLVSKIDLKKPLNWVKDTWNSFRNPGKSATPYVDPIPRLPGSRSGAGGGSSGGSRKPSQPVNLKKHQLH